MIVTLILIFFKKKGKYRFKSSKILCFNCVIKFHYREASHNKIQAFITSIKTPYIYHVVMLSMPKQVEINFFQPF